MLIKIVINLNIYEIKPIQVRGKLNNIYSTVLVQIQFVSIISKYLLF